MAAAARGQFPFGFGGKPEDQAILVRLIQPAGERLSVIPCNLLHRAVRPVETGGVFCHEPHPLGLGDRKATDIKCVQFNAVHRLFGFHSQPECVAHLKHRPADPYQCHPAYGFNQCFRHAFVSRRVLGPAGGALQCVRRQAPAARCANQGLFTLGAAFPVTFDRLAAGRAFRRLQARFAGRANAPAGLDRFAAAGAISGFGIGLGHRVT